MLKLVTHTATGRAFALWIYSLSVPLFILLSMLSTVGDVVLRRPHEYSQGFAVLGCEDWVGLLVCKASAQH